MVGFWGGSTYERFGRPYANVDFLVDGGIKRCGVELHALYRATDAEIDAEIDGDHTWRDLGGSDEKSAA